MAILTFEHLPVRPEALEGRSTIFSQLPLFKGGISSVALKPPLWKRGEGEIFGGTARELYGEFLGQNTSAAGRHALPGTIFRAFCRGPKRNGEFFSKRLSPVAPMAPADQV